MPEVTASQHLQSTTELTVVMPVKSGLIDALDTRTYATRLRILMKALNGLRQSSREKAEFHPISDAVERIETIKSFRLALLDDDTRLLLAVAFDGPWEPYIRKVWYELGPLLDVIVCNCEDYPIAVESSFEEYAAWIRRHQVQTQFFYTDGNLSATDVFYLRQAERNQRETHDTEQREQQAARLYVEEPEQRARQVGKAHPDELLRQGLKALTVLDGLRELYPDGTPAGTYLLRAAHELLRELKAFNTKRLPAPLRAQFESQLQWFEQPRDLRRQPAREAPAIDTADVQGGILSRYPDVQYGALLLFRVCDAEQARQFLAALPVTHEGGKGHNGVYYNLAITLQGLQQLEVDASDIEQFPPEFLQGMEARAGLLGDERRNHPQNWQLPRTDWANSDSTSAREVPLETVDFIVQLRTGKPCQSRPHRILGNPKHPLYPVIDKLAKTEGVELLSVQAMASYERGHFGFVDGISQPVTHSRKRPSNWSDVVAPGEILLGHQNDRDFLTPEQSTVAPLFHNGTFLVIRKIRQHVDALQAFLDEQQDTLDQQGMTPDDLKALMMGRRPDGTPLVPHKGDNDFNYRRDPEGARCPLHSHVRRSNPRHPALGKPADKVPVPRIVRRGMSYGPPVEGNADDADRGLVFLAYNASIANQFEVIQSWLSGGNASNSYSGVADPFLGVPRQGEKRTFRCLGPGGDVLRFDMDRSESDKRPFTTLQWGLYCFVPSLSALQQITRPRALTRHSEQQRGQRWIEKLQSLERQYGADAAAGEWKKVLEDSSAAAAGITSAIWCAIREHHGALRTPYGILVGRDDLVDQVLADDKTFSVRGYDERMQQSLGRIYLGMDSGEGYSRAASVTNDAIANVTEKQGFDRARGFTRDLLAQLQQFSGEGEPVTISLRALVDRVLASLCQHWFDIPDGEHILAGGKPAPKQKTLHCPYHFTAPSRYIFSPNPEAFAAELGQDHGSRLRAAAIAFVRQTRRNRRTLYGAISRPMFAAIDHDETLAQNLIGALMGFLPTTMGSFLKIFYLWMKQDQLARLQREFHRQIKTVGFKNSKALLQPAIVAAMQAAPVPNMIWRTTTRPCTLGDIDLHREHQGLTQPDRVVIGIASVTQGNLAQRDPDVSPVFGGDRGQKQHPTHACPGQAMAMGVLLGMVTALLEGDTLKDGGIPLVLETVKNQG